VRVTLGSRSVQWLRKYWEKRRSEGDRRGAARVASYTQPQLKHEERQAAANEAPEDGWASPNTERQRKQH
jgi:hypothetical protein